MISSDKEKKLFRFLLNRSLDGEASTEEIQQMNTLLVDYPDIVTYYLRLIQIQSMLLEVQVPDESNDSQSTLFDDQFWVNMAEHERIAPEIEIPQERPVREQPQRELIQKVVYPPREKRKVSKYAIFTLINVAAMIIIVFLADLIISNRGIEVATLVDTMNTKWANAAGTVQKGSRLKTRRKELFLNEGLAEISFDNDTRMVIEGPAKFELVAEDQIYLRYGRIYATVSKRAIGFTVDTPTAQIIDLGTEFGVSVDINGDTSLYVTRGKTALIAGTRDTKESIEVTEGMAKQVSGISQTISNIVYNGTLFVRDINSEYNAVWKQQPSLDLADMVRDGNGLGTGNAKARLNYAEGFTAEARWGYASTAKDYLPIPVHPFIDGIFIPNGKTVVSSQGAVFEDFPETGGVYCCDLFASPAQGVIYEDDLPRTIRFDGQEYSQHGKSCIVMQYSNHGITFDLEEIRRSYQTRIDQFACRIGIADFQQKACNANFYVLVDGQVRYSLLQYKQTGVLNDVLVKIEDTDHYLTLATTEAVGNSGTFFDNWCVFAEPVLKFE